MTRLTLPVLTPQGGRTCGPCSLCCRLLPVPELTKDAGRQCPKIALPAGGCSIHPTRPAVCRSFECAWLRGAGDEDQRPDLTGIVVCGESRYGGRIGTVAYAAAESLDPQGPMFDRLERLAAISRRPVFVIVPPVDDELLGCVFILGPKGDRSVDVLSAEAFSWRNTRPPEPAQ